MRVSERLEKIPPYLFAEIDRKIAEAKAKGVDIISLGIGDPDTPTLPPIVEEMHKAIDNPANHDYPPYNGTEKFRKAASANLANDWHINAKSSTWSSEWLTSIIRQVRCAVYVDIRNRNLSSLSAPSFVIIRIAENILTAI